MVEKRICERLSAHWSVQYQINATPPKNKRRDAQIVDLSREGQGIGLSTSFPLEEGRQIVLYLEAVLPTTLLDRQGDILPWGPPRPQSGTIKGIVRNCRKAGEEYICGIQLEGASLKEAQDLLGIYIRQLKNGEDPEKATLTG